VHCPNCRTVLPDAAAECFQCGIIIAKYLKRQESVSPTIENSARRSSSTADAHSQPGSLARLLFGVETTPSSAAVVGRGILLLLLCLWTTTLAGGVSAERVGGSFLHLPNLIFHEAGHFLFLPFGDFMRVLGGSLTQVLVPLVCAGAFLWQSRDPFGAAVAFWWAGENLTDVAPYIDDARALKLVLLGGKTGAEVEGHDWEYLLNVMGVADKDHAIAAAVQAIGVLTMIVALVWGAMLVINQRGMLRRGRPRNI
jgi:hypothetical protein